MKNAAQKINITEATQRIDKLCYLIIDQEDILRTDLSSEDRKAAIATKIALENEMKDLEAAIDAAL